MSFNSIKENQPPREKRYEEETKEIFKHIRDRGGLKIGQYLVNVIVYKYSCETEDEVVDKLWNIEADDLLEAMKKFERR